jgi:hypothetical protein
MNIKQKLRAVIEFLLLEGCEGDNIVFRLQNAYGRDAYCAQAISKHLGQPTEIRPSTVKPRIYASLNVLVDNLPSTLLIIAIDLT